MRYSYQDKDNNYKEFYSDYPLRKDDWIKDLVSGEIYIIIQVMYDHPYIVLYVKPVRPDLYTFLQ